jgi:hypothetical protein
MKYLKYLLFIFGFVSLQTTFGQEKGVIYQKLDTIIFHRYLHVMESKRNSSVGDLITQTAVYLMDSPYAAKTLEVCGKDERLVVNLRQFDCVTFVENCMALVQTLKSRDPGFDTFCKELQQIRYRNGVITDFSSRLHYFTEWISNNETKANVMNLTSGFGGKPLQLNLDFMSRNAQLYPALSDTEIRSEIKETERNISRRTNYFIQKTTAINNKIRNGDILCMTSNLAGMDIAHVGIAFRLGGVLYLIHASLTDMKVEITNDPFDKYIAKHSNMTGYMVVRPL